VLERFTPRFEAWWRERGFAGGAAPFERFERLLADPFLISFIEKAAAFYEADIPAGPTLEFYLLVQPASSHRLSVAYQLERHAAVEVVEGGNPEALIAVLAHEVFHYFFSRMRPERRSALLERVCASESPFAVAAFGVFDEAVATALGNGLVGQHFMEPDAFAKRLARPGGLTAFRAASVVGGALLPSMQGVLDRGTVISSDEFVRVYIAAALATYEGGRPRPIDYLRTHVMVADPRFADAIQRLRDVSFAAHPGLREYTSFDAEAKGFLTEHPFQPAAIFAPGEGEVTAVLEALNAGPKHTAAAAAVAKRARGFVYALPRTPKSYAFIFVAADPQVMKDLVDRFAALSAAGEGVLVELSK
jgi:hypothetical protein